MLTIVAGALAVRLPASDVPTAPPPICVNGVPGGVNCVATKKDLKEARNAYQRGLKLQKQHNFEDAFAQFDAAAHLAPENHGYTSARELLKAQLVYSHVERGNELLTEYQNSKAAAEFRAALDLDPENSFARERLADSMRDSTPTPPPRALSPQLETATEIHIEPKDERASFHYRGDTRGLYSEIASVYGVTVEFDDSVPARQLRFFVDDIDFFTAAQLAGQVSKTMWLALGPKQFFVAADTPQNHKEFDRLLLESFVLPPRSTPAETTELFNTLRTMFDLKSVTSGQTSGTIDVRATAPVLAACKELIEQLSAERPQVNIDVRVYEIDHQLMRNIGMHVPDTFNLYNIPAAALAGLAGLGSGQNISSLINQLISSGGINQAGSSGLSGLLAQLQGGQNSIFSTPLATFGGGLTFMGLSLDQLAANLSVNESWSRSLENVTLRAGQNTDATLHVGERYPIENASYAPIFNSPQIAQVLGNQSYIPPVPSVSYEDLGLEMKLKPIIHDDGYVSMSVELEVRSLTGSSANGIPVIANREYKGWISLKDGESAVVAGEVDENDTRAITGIPGLGALPILNHIAADNNLQTESDELMIVFTPHIVANSIHHTPEIWISER